MISAILLSGGKGSRMGSHIPKQYLSLLGKPIILHSLEALLSFPNWHEIVIVCDVEYQYLFSSYKKFPIRFSLPGITRQESVFSGFNAFSQDPNLICIHDGARPLLQKKDLFSVIEAGKSYGAAALATPLKSTLKEVNEDLFVQKTLDRSLLWEVQTPQVLSTQIFIKGKDFVLKENITTTDDTSLAELSNHAVKLVPGSGRNIKITTPEDVALAALLLEEEKNG